MWQWRKWTENIKSAHQSDLTKATSISCYYYIEYVICSYHHFYQVLTAWDFAPALHHKDCLGKLKDRNYTQLHKDCLMSDRNYTSYMKTAWWAIEIILSHIKTAWWMIEIVHEVMLLPSYKLHLVCAYLPLAPICINSWSKGCNI